jgi:8-oxo-dGTP diphosphatase
MQHSEHFPDSFYRVTVKGACVRDGKILLIKESGGLSGRWELPGGGLDFGESTREGLEREIKEEAGLKLTRISKNPVYAWTYKFSGNPRNFGWYYSLVLIYRIELENLDFTPSEECEAVGLFSKEELQDMKLHPQINQLIDLFNPEDFGGPESAW